MEGVELHTGKAVEMRSLHNIAIILRSQYRQAIFAFMICFVAEIASGYLLGQENQFIYIPGLGLMYAPHLWSIPPEYALPLLQSLRLAIPVIVLFLFYAKQFLPAQAGTWTILILMILTGSLSGNLTGWYFFVISNDGAVPFFYSQYAILLFSGGWLEMSLAALTCILASSLRHNRSTRA